MSGIAIEVRELGAHGPECFPVRARELSVAESIFYAPIMDETSGEYLTDEAGEVIYFTADIHQL